MPFFKQGVFINYSFINIFIYIVLNPPFTVCSPLSPQYTLLHITYWAFDMKTSAVLLWIFLNSQFERLKKFKRHVEY